MNQTDWCTLIVGGVSTSALIIVTAIIPHYKEKKDRKAKLLAGLAALEKSRSTLLTFKHQYILQRFKDATRLAHYITNFELIEPYINKAIEDEIQKHVPTTGENQLDLPTHSFSINLADLIKSNSTLNEKEDDLDINIINEANSKLFTLSVKQIEALYHFIFANLNLFPKTLNTSYAEKSVLTKDLPEKLYFVANYNPGVLIGLEQATENLNQINLMITQWNELIKKHQTIKSPTVQDMATHISYFLSFSNSIYEIGVEGTLMSIKTSMDHLVEYARTQFKDHKSFEIYGKSFHEELMPKLCDASIKIKENLDSMRIK